MTVTQISCTQNISHEQVILDCRAANNEALGHFIAISFLNYLSSLSETMNLVGMLRISRAKFVSAISPDVYQ